MRTSVDARTADAHDRSPPAGRGRLRFTAGQKRQVTAYVAAVRESDEIDRAAWAKLLTELLNSAGLTPEQADVRAGGPVNAPWRTIRKWLSQETGVSARRVRDVARDLGYPTAHALVQVGFLSREEVGLSGPVRPTAGPDPLLRRVGNALTNETIPEDLRAKLRRGVQAAYDSWLDWLKTLGQETSTPPARARTRR